MFGSKLVWPIMELGWGTLFKTDAFVPRLFSCCRLINVRKGFDYAFTFAEKKIFKKRELLMP